MSQIEKLKSSLAHIENEDITKLKEIIKSIKSDPNAIPFKNPLNLNDEGLKDYLIIVKTPMDLLTIEKKLARKQYEIIQNVFDDIQLVWDNCRLFNIEGSYIYNQADYMDTLSKEIFGKVYKFYYSGTKYFIYLF
jgi:hypothetical protein